MTPQQTAKVRELNDALRSTFSGGRVMLTQGIKALGAETLLEVVKAVQGFDAFTPDNDPQNEHDFGSFEIEGTRCFFKHDYYASGDMDYGSEEPWNPDATTRVLTIALMSEY